MVDGVILTLLEKKWRTYIRSKFMWRYLMFILYYIVHATGFFLQPHRKYVEVVSAITASISPELVLLLVQNPIA